MASDEIIFFRNDRVRTGDVSESHFNGCGNAQARYSWAIVKKRAEDERHSPSLKFKNRNDDSEPDQSASDAEATTTPTLLPPVPPALTYPAPSPTTHSAHSTS